MRTLLHLSGRYLYFPLTYDKADGFLEALLFARDQQVAHPGRPGFPLHLRRPSPSRAGENLRILEFLARSPARIGKAHPLCSIEPAVRRSFPSSDWGAPSTG